MNGTSVDCYCGRPNCVICIKRSESGGTGYFVYNTDTTKQILLRIEEKLDRLLSKTEDSDGN